MRNYEEILTLEEVSQLLRVSKESLYQNVRKGKVPAQKVGHQWRFVRSQIMKWLKHI